jgi:ABC-type sugar transport system ATPase subunit
MIEISNIQVSTGDFQLSAITLALEVGKFHVLLGPSGSGKTILLETIAGLIPCEKGEIFRDGEVITLLPPEQRNLSYVTQDHVLFPHKTVYENMAFGLQFKSIPPEVQQEKIQTISNDLELNGLLHRGVANLSGGERQRVALARALVLDNPLILLDEPTSSLHETMQENFGLLLRQIQQKYGLTVLMTTHHKDTAFLVADCLHFIENGKLLLSKDSNQIFSDAIPGKVAELLGISNFFTVKNENNRLWCTELDMEIHLRNFPEEIHFSFGVKPIDIRVIKEEELHLPQTNAFETVVDRVYWKESDALVLLHVKNTGFPLKLQLPTHNLQKMKISEGSIVWCKLNPEYCRLIS